MPVCLQRKICLLVLSLFSVCEVAAESGGLSGQLPPGYATLKSVVADFNQDGRDDYIVVAHKPDEAKMVERGLTAPRRPLLVFIQQPDGTFRLVARNDRVVYAADEGGQCDPFLDDEQGVVAKGAFFTVQNSVACGSLWTDYITFKYSADTRQFVFHKRIYENWRMNNSTAPDAEALILAARRVSKAGKERPISLPDYQLHW